MDIVIKPSGGANIVVRPQALPRWSPAATVDPVQVEVWWREIAADGTVGAWVKLDSFAPGAKGSMPYNPALDRNVEFSLISVSAAGVKSVMHPDDGVRATMLMQRITAAPVISQYGDATVDEVSIGIDAGADQEYVRKIRLKYSDTLSGGGALVSPTVVEFNYLDGKAPAILDLLRTGAFVSTFSWSGLDPASNGFTKTGAAPVDFNSPGWRINSAGTGAATYYTKNGWPAGAFAAGFTLEMAPPLVVGSTAAGTSMNAGVTVDDGAHRYELKYSADKVALNGGTERLTNGLRARLVIAAGGATADLWIGAVKVETATAAVASVASGLRFGDLVTTDDAAVTWLDLNYALTPEPVTLARTVYATVALSGGGAYGVESAVLTLSFGADNIITTSTTITGTTGDFDPQPRGKLNYDTGLPI